MFDNLLPYYDEELSFLKYMGEKFAKRYPKIAGRIRLDPSQVEDPHTARLIQSVALLNARISRKLDDDFPELCEALMDNLYPHYQVPIPSMSVLQFEMAPDNASSYEIPSDTQLQVFHPSGVPCYFNTCYSTTVWPLQIVQAAKHGHSISSPPIPHQESKILSSIHIILESFHKKPILKLNLNRLRFHINAQLQHSYLIYELILNNTITVALAKSHDDPSPIILDKDNIRPVGFSENEGMLRYSPRSFLGYRLLTEFFTFPQKFLFFDLVGLDTVLWESFENTLCIYFYLNDRVIDLENKISKSTFLLGCTPIVNLFEQKAEPLTVSHTQYEYPIVPDARRIGSTEINSITCVSLIGEDGIEKECFPFYGLKHRLNVNPPAIYWHSTRRNILADPKASIDGTEVYISFTDLDMNTMDTQKYITHVETVCTNRDVPSQLPFGGETLKFQLETGEAPLSRIRAVFPFTETKRLPLQPGDRWRLISHLSLTHLSLSNDNYGLDALKEILELYNYNNLRENNSIIDRISDLKCRKTTSRITDMSEGITLCQGLEITLQFDRAQGARGEEYLFSNVLECFFALYCNINSFTQLVIKDSKSQKEIKRWAPRAGFKELL